MHACLNLGDTLMASDTLPGDTWAEDRTKASRAARFPCTRPAWPRPSNVRRPGRRRYVIMPLEKTFWAERFGMLTDRFGLSWMVNCD